MYLETNRNTHTHISCVYTYIHIYTYIHTYIHMSIQRERGVYIWES